jgi:phosphate transport system protein
VGQGGGRPASSQAGAPFLNGGDETVIPLVLAVSVTAWPYGKLKEVVETAVCHSEGPAYIEEGRIEGATQRLFGDPRDMSDIPSGFQDSLDQLRRDVLTMASNAELNLEHAVRGLIERNGDLCSTAIVDDEEVDQLEKRIDAEGMRVLARYNPMGRELREIVATMKMATNLERVSDEAGNIARRARLVLRNREIPECKLIDAVFQIASRILHASVRAFAERDLEMARSIDAMDTDLDDAHNRLVKQLRTRMEQDPAHLKDYLDLMFMVRSLERVGDHATNLAEDTIFIESAEDVRHN